MHFLLIKDLKYNGCFIGVKVNSHCTRHDASRYIALRRVASYTFCLIHSGKASSAVLVKMASQQQDMLLALALQNQVIALVLLQKQKKKRSVWVHELRKERKVQGHHDNLIKEMRLKDHTMHFNYFRMLPSMFDELLSLVGPSIVRKGSNFREPLSPSL